MPRCSLMLVALFAALGWSSPARAVDFFWTGPALGGPGGNFGTAQNWTFFPPPFPLDPAPGGANDTVNFDLGIFPEDRYTVTDVSGDNYQLLVLDDSLLLEINSYQLHSEEEDNRSLIVGLTSSDEADLILRGVGAAMLRTNSTVVGLGDGSMGKLTVEQLQWANDGPLNVGGISVFVGQTGGNGELTIRNGSQVASNSGGIGSALGSLGEATVAGNGSIWFVSETVTVGGQGLGVLTIQNGGSVSSNRGTILGNSTVTVDGAGSSWIVNGSISMFQQSSATLNIQNGGLVTAGLNGQIVTANSSAEITLDSDGVLDVRTMIEMNNGAFNFLGGTLHVGEFDDNLVNQGGTLAPGQSAGSTNITGNYTHQSAATLDIEIGGTTQGTKHDFVNVEGTASIAGELELVLIDEFIPAPDDEFVVFNTDTLWIGSFSNVADGQRLATIDGLGSFQVHYGPTSMFNANQVVLTDFLLGLPGDYNQDGAVDAADYVVWRKNLGSGTSLPNDDTTGVGPDDYTRWVANFGQTGGAGAGSPATDSPAVPEPSAFVLVFGCLVLPLLSVSRKR